MILAHIAGIPVEETLLGFGPAGLAGLGVVVYSARGRLRSLRDRGAAMVLRDRADVDREDAPQ